MIQVRRLSKSFGPVRALDDVSFDVPKGEIVGLLGRNGAGKSTLQRIITGYLPPTRGDASIAGISVVRDSLNARRNIGYLPESTPLYSEMRVSEYLHYLGRLNGMTRKARLVRIDQLADLCALQQIRRRVIGGLSKGNRQRVGLAQALIHEPDVVVLDEPTSGLDPGQTLAFRALLAGLRGQHTVLLSSHLLTEVERSVDRVVVLEAGHVKAQGRPAELRDQAARGAVVLIEVRGTATRAISLLQAVKGVATVTLEEASHTEHADRGPWVRLRVQPKASSDVREAVAAAAAGAGLPVRELTREASLLESYFSAVASETTPPPSPSEAAS